MRPIGGDEDALQRRTWRRIAIQTALLFAVAVVALEGLAVGIVLRTGADDVQRRLDQASTDPDALTNPPPDIAVYEENRGAVRHSPGAPDHPVDESALRDHQPREITVSRGDRTWIVRTYQDGSTTRQVALDLTAQDRERDRLYGGLAAAGGVGVVLSGVIGAVIARRAIAPLGQALARQQRFIADASHELRTPLTQLHLRAQILERELRATAGPERLREDAQQLVRGTRQMGEVVGDLLLAAQLRGQPQQHEPVDLADVVLATVAADRPRADQRGVGLTATVPGPTVVHGVESALQRVFASLVDNALSHTPAGGTITLHLHVDAPAAQAVVDVRDTGEGFDPAQSERMFDRFARGGHGDQRRFGLGLSLVREVVNAHGGTVTADAQPGQGACFTVRLPMGP